MLGGEAADFTSADDQYLPSLTLPENLPCVRECGIRDRHGALTERGLASHAFTAVERPLERWGQQRPGTVTFRCGLEGVFDLSENLRFADNDRILAGRDPEQMASCL